MGNENLRRGAGLLKSCAVALSEAAERLSQLYEQDGAEAPAPKCPDYGEPLKVEPTTDEGEGAALSTADGMHIVTVFRFNRIDILYRMATCTNAMQGLDPEALKGMIDAWRALASAEDLWQWWGDKHSAVGDAFARLTGEACPEPGATPDGYDTAPDVRDTAPDVRDGRGEG